MTSPIPAFATGFDGKLWIIFAAMAVNLLFWRANVLERAFASPLALGSRMLDVLERRYNRPELSERERRREGISVFVLVAGAAVTAGFGIFWISQQIPYGWWLQALCLSVLLTQREGFDEMRVLCRSLRRSTAEARATLAMIDQSDATNMDDSMIARTGVEHLALGFNRGVMAVLFYMLLGGLPLAFLYKIINIADWMLGAKTRDASGFGHIFAFCNRVLLWPPAVLSTLLLALLAPFACGARALGSLPWAVRGARLHPLSLDGWLWGAWAAAVGVRLGGPHHYDGWDLDVPSIGNGREIAEHIDLDRAVALYVVMCIGLALAVALLISFPLWTADNG